MSNITNIFKKIISENDFEYETFKNYKFEEADYFDVIVVSRKAFDYIIFIEIDYELLKQINSNIQINMATKFKNYLKDHVDVSRFFDNNTYLIIATEVPNEIESKVLYREISSVEEDPYYFKKQVLYYTKKEIENLNFDALVENSSSYFNAVVSKIDRYEKYLADSDLEYGLIVRFFEKFPFLKFQVEKKELLNLEQMIENELNDVDLELLPEILGLTDENIDTWVGSLGSEI